MFGPHGAYTHGHNSFSSVEWIFRACFVAINRGSYSQMPNSTSILYFTTVVNEAKERTVAGDKCVAVLATWNVLAYLFFSPNFISANTEMKLCLALLSSAFYRSALKTVGTWTKGNKHSILNHVPVLYASNGQRHFYECSFYDFSFKMLYLCSSSSSLLCWIWVSDGY